MIFLDTETCGFHGPTVLIQWARDDGPVHLHHVWKTPIQETLDLIEMFCEEPDGIVGFNLAFDWFHLCQTYTTLRLIEDKTQWPEDCIDDYAILEKEARFGPCLKPVTAMDLFLHARKGPYQATMEREDIRVKRVPTALAEHLANELERRIPFNEIYFARRADKTARKWKVMDIKDDIGDVIPEFKDVVLSFAPSSALKALAVDALGLDVTHFDEISLPSAAQPVEYGYAPFALAVGEPGHWRGAWPDFGKIRIHIDHWAYNEQAREYATNDVVYTRALWDYFGRPDSGDNDSILACMVGACRWRGYSVDIPKLQALRERAVEAKNAVRLNFNSTEICRRYLMEAMSDTEAITIAKSTKGVILEAIANWTVDTVCEACNGLGCEKCDDGLIHTLDRHPAAIRAQHILDARHATKEIELFDKILFAGRFHASFKVIGALSSRMSGADKLNPQGIKREEEVRAAFTLGDDDLILCGGDFDSFEVALAEAYFNDPKLRETLTSGKKIHALFASELFGLTYDEILATAKTANDLYSKGKQGVFAWLYGGTPYTLQTKLGVTEERAQKAMEGMERKYPNIGKERQKIFDMFCSMRQPKGLGTEVEWHEPADYIETMFGFRRYFTLENRVCKTLFDLATDPPKEWQRIKIKVVRRDREQTACGALRSALFGCAFGIQAGNMRAAGNHKIQGSGAGITKHLQREVWEFQPAGVHMWMVQPLNIHDELMTPTRACIIDAVKARVDEVVDSYKPQVPLIAMDWHTHMTSWGEK